MLDLFLRAADREAMWSAYHAAGLTRPVAEADAGDTIEIDGVHHAPAMASHHWSLDDGIAIVVTPAETDPETGAVTTPAVMSTLWHANLRLLADAATIRAALLEAGAEEVSPATPQRVFG